MRDPLLATLLAVALLAAGCMNTAPPPADADEAALPPPVEGNPQVLQLRDRVHEAVASGAPTTLTAAPVVNAIGLGSGNLGDPQEFQVTLQPSSLLTNNTWAEVDGVPVEVPHMEVYEGHVVDAIHQPVRLVLTTEWARGYILGSEQRQAGQEIAPLPYLIRIGLEGNLPAGAYPEDDRERSAALSQHPGRFDHEAWPEQDCLELVPPHLTPTTGRPVDHDTITARIILDGDAQYMQALGDDAFPMMVAMLSESDAIYEREVAIRYEIVGLHMHTDPDAFPPPSQRSPFQNLSQYWNDRLDVERDIVHLYTGQQSSYAMANCIGGAGIPELGYTFTPLNWERDHATFHTTAVAHELGHIFSAHHHYGNHAETGANLATLMIQGYTPGFRPAFSTMSQTSIRGWAEEYLAGGAAVTMPPGAVDEAVHRLADLYSHDWDEIAAMDLAHGAGHAQGHSLHDAHGHAHGALHHH